ncbi:MAG: nucleotide exchange factor GrpE [Anaerolineae bacterium]
MYSRRPPRPPYGAYYRSQRPQGPQRPDGANGEGQPQSPQNQPPTGGAPQPPQPPRPETVDDRVERRVVAEFEKELAQARREKDEANDKYMRALAELDNVRKRAERVAEQRLAGQRTSFFSRFLAVVDNMELALLHGDPGDPLYAGVELTYKEMLRALAENGVERMDPTGQEFDPATDEAVDAAPIPDVPSGTVVEVLRAGYKYGDQILRPAQVRVAL